MNATFSKALEIGASNPMVVNVSLSNEGPCANLVIAHKAEAVKLTGMRRRTNSKVQVSK